MTVYKKGDPKIPRGAVYIGRPSPWGNPFVIGRDGSRKEVIRRYEAWLRVQPARMEAVRRDLKGKDLICFCAPLACHGDVLHKIANETDDISDLL